jgi:DNA primase
MSERGTVTQTVERGQELMKAFSSYLRKCPEGMEYVRGRNIPEHLIDEGIIGFTPPYLNHWFPLLRGRIVTPICDVSGNVRAFAGRILPSMEAMVERSFRDNCAPEYAQKMIDHWANAKWVNEPYAKRRHVYNLNRAKPYVRERGYIVLVEGYFDTVVLSSRHLENTGALCGTALSEYHAAIIARFCDEAVLLMDGDTAGRRAAEQSIPTLQGAGLKCRRVFLPEDYDPDDFAVQFGGKNLRRAIEGMREQDQDELQIQV